MNNKNHINKLIMEQINVLSHIDHNSDFTLKKPYLKSTLDKITKENKLNALEMSKKIAFTCYMLMRYQNNEINLNQALEILKDCLNTKYHHTYSISATWNLSEIYNILYEQSLQQ